MKFRYDTHTARACGDSFLLWASCCFLLFSPFKFYYHSNTLYIFFTHIILFWTCRLLIFFFFKYFHLSLSFLSEKEKKSLRVELQKTLYKYPWSPCYFSYNYQRHPFFTFLSAKATSLSLSLSPPSLTAKQQKVQKQ